MSVLLPEKFDNSQKSYDDLTWHTFSQPKDQILIPFLVRMTEGSNLGSIEKSAPITGMGEGCNFGTF